MLNFGELQKWIFSLALLFEMRLYNSTLRSADTIDELPIIRFHQPKIQMAFHVQAEGQFCSPLSFSMGPHSPCLQKQEPRMMIAARSDSVVRLRRNSAAVSNFLTTQLLEMHPRKT